MTNKQTKGTPQDVIKAANTVISISRREPPVESCRKDSRLSIYKYMYGEYVKLCKGMSDD